MEDDEPLSPSNDTSLLYRKRSYDGDEDEIADTKTKKGGKKARRNAESGESKDPKYLLTDQVVDVNGVKYCRAYRRPPVIFENQPT
jgi:hypothetical protein